MTDEELKALVASNAQGIAELRAGIADMREYQQTEAAAWRERTEQLQTEWRTVMRESYDDMVSMLRQFAEEAAADRAAVREMVQAMFRHSQNGGGQG